jgi:hypothetical protein
MHPEVGVPPGRVDVGDPRRRDRDLELAEPARLPGLAAGW